MHLLLEAPGVGVSEGQDSSPVMGGSGGATPLCIRVGRGMSCPHLRIMVGASSRATLASS